MRPLGRPRCRWENNFRMDLRKSRVWKSGLDTSNWGWGPVV